MAALSSDYQALNSWCPTASTTAYGITYHAWRQIDEERSRAFKEQIALLAARDKRERKARRDRLVIAGMARQQGLQACAAIRERRFQRGKRQIPDRLAQRCRRVFR